MARVLITESERQRFLLKPHDLLFARRSLVLSGAGKCAIIMSVPEPTTFKSSIIRVRINEQKSEPLFWYYYFTSSVGRADIEAIVTQLNVSGIRSSELSEIAVLAPPPDIQRRIANILSAYDDLIELNLRRIAIQEEFVRRLFDEWMIKLRRPGPEVTPLIGSKSDSLPEGWEKACLADLVDDIRNSVLPSQIPPDTPYVGLEHMPRRSTTLLSFGRADEVRSTKLKYRSGDILFAKIRPYFHKVVFATSSGVTSTTQSSCDHDLPPSLR